MLKFPSLGFHKLLKRQPLHTEMIANIWDFYGVGLENLHGHACSIFDRCFCNNEGIGVFPSLQNLLQFDILLEARSSVYLRGRRRCLAAQKKARGKRGQSLTRC
jgi:hypothetical protein